MQRQTIQKQIILGTLQKLGEKSKHFSVEEIYSVIIEDYSSISKTTVYRNVRQLAESGVLRRITLEDGLERYDMNTHDHYHFICTDCSEIIDVDIEQAPTILPEFTEQYGLEVMRTNLTFSGRCLRCK